jgi:hypothetical protein
MKCEICLGQHLTKDHERARKPSAASGLLTEREKWLMELAYEYGAAHPDIYFVNWLASKSVNDVTVEMVLAKEAP